MPALPKGRIGPSNVGMVANLRLDISVAPNKHPGHDILGHVGLHLARIAMLDQASTPPGAHRRRHPKGKPGSTIDVFANARASEGSSHSVIASQGRARCNNSRGWVGETSIWTSWGGRTCLGTSLGHTMEIGFHGVLLVLGCVS